MKVLSKKGNFTKMVLVESKTKGVSTENEAKSVSTENDPGLVLGEDEIKGVSKKHESSPDDLTEEDSFDLWAEREFGGVDLGDTRRTRRLVKIASAKARNTLAAMSLCCKKNDSQSVCRLFGRKEATLDSVIRGHKKRTAERCGEYSMIYAVQDTTFLDFTSHKALEGLGRICHKKSGYGLVMHSGLAVTPDKTPLGFLSLDIWSRGEESKDTSKQRKIEEKESFKWLRAKESAEELVGNSCRIIHVADREGDFFELFAAKRPANVDLLVRASFDRCARSRNDGEEEMGKLFSLMEKTKPIGEYTLKNPARKGKKARETTMVVRFGRVEFWPHQYLRKQGYSEPVVLSWVWAVEKEPPPNPDDLVDWKLLTTLPVNSFEGAINCIKGYSTRWVIEECHRVVKSGCKIEGLQFESLDRMYPAMAVCCVVAWRVLYLSKYARENPDGDAGLVSSGVEQVVLESWLKSQGIKDCKVKTVRDFVRGVGILGGLPARKSAGNPGTKTLWLGIRRLDDLVQGYLLATQIQQPSRI